MRTDQDIINETVNDILSSKSFLAEFIKKDILTNTTKSIVRAKNNIIFAWFIDYRDMSKVIELLQAELEKE